MFKAKTRTIRIRGSSDDQLCIVSAYKTVVNLRNLHGRPLAVPLAGLSSAFDSFSKFVAELQRLIPQKADTAWEKGTVTGHSCRRGFTKAALAAGISLDRIMIHGDWSHEDSVLDSYAVGAVLPSVSGAANTPTTTEKQQQNVH